VRARELPSRGEEFEGVLACDLRITLAWDADETDVDIHVTEPSGEEAFYAHRYTFAGGRVSEDITDGFGPELYEIRQAKPGTYTIRAHYYASHQQTIFGPATCTLTVYTDWGRAEQAHQVTTARLDNEKAMIPVGTASYGTAEEGVQLAGEAPTEEAGRRIRRGMTPAEVTELLGEPLERNDEGGGEIWVYALPADRRLGVLFADGVVERVVEQMAWGDVMVWEQ
jgi:outer membrane protein assembly factor BamE (lipoprotein component of BamABCDE complex)